MSSTTIGEPVPKKALEVFCLDPGFSPLKGDFSVSTSNRQRGRVMVSEIQSWTHTDRYCASFITFENTGFAGLATDWGHAFSSFEIALEKGPTANSNESKAAQRVLLEARKFWSDVKRAERQCIHMQFDGSLQNTETLTFPACNPIHDDLYASLSSFPSVVKNIFWNVQYRDDYVNARSTQAQWSQIDDRFAALNKIEIPPYYKLISRTFVQSWKTVTMEWRYIASTFEIAGSATSTVLREWDCRRHDERCSSSYVCCGFRNTTPRQGTDCIPFRLSCNDKKHGRDILEADPLDYADLVEGSIHKSSRFHTFINAVPRPSQCNLVTNLYL